MNADLSRNGFFKLVLTRTRPSLYPYKPKPFLTNTSMCFLKRSLIAFHPKELSSTTLM